MHFVQTFIYLGGDIAVSGRGEGISRTSGFTVQVTSGFPKYCIQGDFQHCSINCGFKGVWFERHPSDWG